MRYCDSETLLQLKEEMKEKILEAKRRRYEWKPTRAQLENMLLRDMKRASALMAKIEIMQMELDSEMQRVVSTSNQLAEMDRQKVPL